MIPPWRAVRRWPTRVLASAAGAFLGADWGAAIAAAIHSRGAAIPLEANLSIVLGLACLGALFACRLARRLTGIR
jgi:hypothetical protein